MRAKIKIVIDAGMIILVLLQMEYHLIGDSLHGWIGMILFILLASVLFLYGMNVTEISLKLLLYYADKS